MSVQNVSLGSMFGWVAESLKLVRKNFRAFMSAGMITLVLALLLCIPMLVVMALNTASTLHEAGPAHGLGVPMAGDMTLFFTAYAATLIFGLLFFPPMLIGWFKLCLKTDKDIAVGSFEILQPYKDIKLWLRGIGFALLGLLVYLSILGLFVLAFSGVISDFIDQINAQQMAALSGTPPPPPNLPIAFFLGYFCFIFIAMFLQLVYMVGFTEISLRTTPVLQAMKLAMASVFRNALKLLLALICIGVVLYIAMFIAMLIIVLIATLLSFIHPIAGAIVALVFFIPMLLITYPLIFSGHYFMWKDLLAEDATTAPAPLDSSLPA